MFVKKFIHTHTLLHFKAFGFEEDLDEPIHLQKNKN